MVILLLNKFLNDFAESRLLIQERSIDFHVSFFVHENIALNVTWNARPNGVRKLIDTSE